MIVVAVEVKLCSSSSVRSTRCMLGWIFLYSPSFKTVAN